MSQNENKIVVVSCSNGPGDFYVLEESFLKHENNYNVLISKLACNSSVPCNSNLLEVNKVYFTQHRDVYDKYRWFRVKLLQELKAENMWRVLFIDYGNVELVHKNSFKKCHPSANYVVEIKPKAMHCRFSNDDEINVMNLSLFNFLVSSRRFFELKILEEATSDGIYTVDLITTGTVQCSITEYLNFSNSWENYEEIGNPPSIEEMEFRNGMQVKIKHINSPVDFYLIPKEMEDEEEVMKIELTSFYESNPIQFVMPIQGTLCAVSDDKNNWYRAQVINSDDQCGTKVKVRLIDDGREVLACLDELFELNPQFLNFPRYAKKFALSNIQAIDGDWIQATNFMKNTACCYPCPISINIVDENEIELFAHFEGLKISIVNSMAYMQCAKKSKNDEEQKLFEVAEQSKGHDKAAEFHPVEVQFLKSMNPKNFTVTFKDFRSAIDAMEDLIMNFNGDSKHTWKIGDKCLIELEMKNGICIARAEIENIRGQKVDVQLLDRNIKFNSQLKSLKSYPEELEGFGKTYENVKLDCDFNNSTFLRFMGENMFGSILKGYSHFHVQFRDDERQMFTDSNKPRPVSLFCRKKHSPHTLDAAEELKHLGIENYNSPEKKPKSFMERLEMKFAEEIENRNWPSLESVQAPSRVSIGQFQVKLKKRKVGFWQEPSKFTASKFSGSVTGIDINMNFYIQNHEFMEDLTQMEKLICNQYFRDNKDSTHNYKVGDSCTAKYLRDNRFYRATIINVNDNGTYRVLFIDYGTQADQLTPQQIYPDFMCLEVPKFAHLVRLKGKLNLGSCEYDEFFNDVFESLIDLKVNFKLVNDEIEESDSFESYCEIFFGKFALKTFQDLHDFTKRMCENRSLMKI